jgi:flagellar hook assembly protein FlgD
MMEGGSAEIVVYDVLGRHVRTLVKGVVPAGDQEVVWDGRDDSGNLVSSGVYFYQLRAGNVVETQRMVLLK